MIRLISATPSPFARKVRIALIEKGIPFELTTEVPWNSDTTLPTHNPLEKLPVLIPDDEEAVYDSRFILAWLEARYPAPAMFPADPEALLAARRIEVIADGICDAVILTLFERQRGAPSEPWLARQRRKIDGGVAALAARCSGRRFAVGDAFGLADIAAGSALGYLAVRLPEKDWRAEHPELVGYAEALFARPSFASTQPTPQTVRDPVV
jgi:glutathione S-transferase